MSLIDFHTLTLKIVNGANVQSSIIFTIRPGVVEKKFTTIINASFVDALMAIGAPASAITLYMLQLHYAGDATPKYLLIVNLLIEQIMFKDDGTFEKMPVNVSSARLVEVIGWLK